MRFNDLQLRALITFSVIASILAVPFNISGQFRLQPIGTAGESVFVFRSIAKAVKRFVPASKPTRTKDQRMATAVKIKKQYETIAKTNPKVNRAKAVEPDKLPKNVRTLPAAEGSKLFAGVGEYYNDQGDYEKAMEFFRDAVTLDETNTQAKAGFSEALAIKGNDLLVKDQAATAKGVFLEALKLDPKNSAAYFGLGEVYAALDQTADAIAAYEKSLENNKDLTEIYVPLGILYYQAGDIEKADTLLTKALTFSANSAETQFFLGLVRSSQNRNEEALTAFQKAKSIDPTSAEAHFYAGEMLVRLKRVADAVPEFTKATDLKPTYFDAWFNLGEAYLELGKHEEAIVAYIAAKKLQNNNWEVFAGLGEAYRETRKFEDAAANYQNAALFYNNVPDKSKETLAGFYNKIGHVLGQQCDLINAPRNIMCNWRGTIRALQQAADISNDPIDQGNVGWAYFRMGHEAAVRKDMATAKPDLELAQAALQKAVAAGPPASEFALQNLGAVQIDLGDYPGAIDTFTKLIAIKPELNFAKYALGAAYNRSGDMANAEKWLKAASDAEPTNLGYLVGLADTLLTRKNGKELQKVIDRIRPLDAAMAANFEQRKKLLRL